MICEIVITTNGDIDEANLIVEGSNVACIRGDIRLSSNWKTHECEGVLARIDGDIVGQFHNVNMDYTIRDNRGNNEVLD